MAASSDTRHAPPALQQARSSSVVTSVIFRLANAPHALAACRAKEPVICSCALISFWTLSASNCLTGPLLLSPVRTSVSPAIPLMPLVVVLL